MSEYYYTNHPTKCKPNGKPQSMLVHRKIWIKHYGEIPKDFIIHHKNGNKKDNRIENLQSISRSEHTKSHTNRNVVPKPNSVVGNKKLSKNH